MKQITNAQEFNQVVSQEKPVLLDFYADWCGPCQSLMPVVEEIAKDYANDFEVRKINVDQYQELAQQFNVRSIPALFIVHDKEVKESFKGYRSKAQLEEILDQYVVTN